MIPYLKGTDKQTITVRSLLYHESGLPASISFYREAIDKESYEGNILSNRRDRLHTVQIAARDWVNPNYQYHDSLVSSQQSSDYPLQIAEGLWLSPLFKEVYRTKIVEATLRSRSYRYSDVNFILLQQMVEQLTGMPPACIVTAELDSLRDEAELYGRKLIAAGVPVWSRRFLGSSHGFTMTLGGRDPLMPEDPNAKIACGMMMDALWYALS